jgi:hypothetical protein
MKFTSIDLDVQELLSWEQCINEIALAEGYTSDSASMLVPTADAPVIRTTGEMVKKWRLTNVTKTENAFGRDVVTFADVDVHFCSAHQETVRTEITFLAMVRQRLIEAWSLIERDLKKMGRERVMAGYELSFKTAMTVYLRQLATMFELNDIGSLREPFRVDESLQVFDSIMRYKSAALVTHGLTHAVEEYSAKNKDLGPAMRAPYKVLQSMANQILRRVSEMNLDLKKTLERGGEPKTLLQMAYDALEDRIAFTLEQMKVKYIGEHLARPKFSFDMPSDQLVPQARALGVSMQEATEGFAAFGKAMAKTSAEMTKLMLSQQGMLGDEEKRELRQADIAKAIAEKLNTAPFMDKLIAKAENARVLTVSAPPRAGRHEYGVAAAAPARPALPDETILERIAKRLKEI